jgi:hypothetical protein
MYAVLAISAEGKRRKLGRRKTEIQGRKIRKLRRSKERYFGLN